MTKPNDLSSFSLILPFHCCCTQPLIHAVYKGEHKEYNSSYFVPILQTQHCTQLVNYHLPIFEVVIIKKAKRRQSAALPVCCLWKMYIMSKSLKIDLNYKIFGKSQANILLRYYE